jgi:hypothetical protein
LKKLAFVGLAVAAATSATLVATRGHAADHLDAPAFQTATANHMADINDVYAWMTSDASKVNLVMTVSPADDSSRHFGPSVQYVFHVNEYAGATNEAAYGTTPTEHRVICTFASDTSAQCWIATGTTVSDYVKGDPTATGGITSADGKVRLFAGRRSDPFFFNLAGFKKAVQTIDTACGAPTMACPGALPKNAAGCPTLPATTVGPIAAQLSTTQTSPIAPCAANQPDCFANFDVHAIVLQIDKTALLGTGHHLLSVWGSTHMGS